MIRVLLASLPFFTNAVFRKFTQTSDFFSIVPTSLDESNFIKRIQQYGCYCYPNLRNNPLTGQGPPVDDIDAACQRYQKCRKCLEIQIDADMNWDALNYKYDSDDLDNGILTCTNSDDQKQKLCLCDKEFAEGLAAVGDFDGIYDLNFWLNKKHVGAQQKAGNPTFDYENTCRGLSSGVGPADSCCGTEYPFVFPYNSDGKSCCANPTGGFGRTYDPDLFDCCNGEVKQSCV